MQTIHINHTQHRMHNPLRIRTPNRHIMPTPQLGELRTTPQQLGNHRARLLIMPTPARHRSPQIRDETLPMPRMILHRIQRPRARISEPPIHKTRLHPHHRRRRPQQRRSQRILHQNHMQIRDHPRRSTDQPIQQIQHPRMHMRRTTTGRRHRTPRQLIQMITLITRQPQRPRERRQHLLRRLRPTPLHLDVVIHRRPRQLRHLITTQPRHPTPRPSRQPHIRRPNPITPRLQKPTKLTEIHTTILSHPPTPSQGVPTPG